ncbi:T-cell differentiation antigen CD6 [Trichinella pseudospiralis]
MADQLTSVSECKYSHLNQSDAKVKRPVHFHRRYEDVYYRLVCNSEENLILLLKHCSWRYSLAQMTIKLLAVNVRPNLNN